MLEIQLFLTILKRCQSFCPVHFLSSVWNDGRFGFFFFLWISNANKINQHENIKAFVIATIWEKCII